MSAGRQALLPVLATALALAGCVQLPAGVDPADAVTDAAGHVVPLPETITALAPLAKPEIETANDLAFRDQFVYVGGTGGMHVVDVSDPAAPVVVSEVPCASKDIGVVQVGARRIVTLSWQSDDGCPESSPTGGIRLVDVTDPVNPVVLKSVALAYGSHTHTPYGDTGIIYNSAYDIPVLPKHRQAEIVDVSNPDDPKQVGTFAFPLAATSPGCHDILAEPERDRAICAGITETMIWDTTDPAAPTIVSYIRNPAISIHHSAATARDGKLLILGDEFAGVLAPGCHPREDAPTGALWFYDIAEPQAPEELGYFPPPAGAPGKACTAHNFNVVPGRDLVVSAFYSGGTILVDFTDPASPVAVSRFQESDSNAWAAYEYAGRVFVGDGARGLDVLGFE